MQTFNDYLCDVCGARVTDAAPPHNTVIKPNTELADVCLEHWQANQEHDAQGRVIPPDASDAPWEYMATGARDECDCDCHCCGIEGVARERATDEGWQSVYEYGDAESGPRLNVTTLCRVCVDDDHGRFY